MPTGMRSKFSASKTLQNEVACTFVTHQECDIDEVVCLVGEAETIGAWNLSKAIELTRHRINSTCWHTLQSVNLPCREKIPYKYFVRNKRQPELIQRWETLTGVSGDCLDTEGSNRVVVPNGGFMTIEDDGCRYRSLLKSSVPVESNTVKGLSPAPIERDYSSVRHSSDCGRMVFTEGCKPPDVRRATYFAALELPITVTKQDDKWVRMPGKSLLGPSLWRQRHSTPGSTYFVGLPCLSDVEMSDLSHTEQREIEELLLEVDCIPVWVDKSTTNSFWQFSHVYLWHFFHGLLQTYPHDVRKKSVKTTYAPPRFTDGDRRAFTAYGRVNQAFADALVTWATPGDILLVNDFPLLLLPQKVRRIFKQGIRIGLFFHCPFPSSEIYKQLYIREELLNAILCADMVGFHFFEYASHFLSCCRRFFGFEHHMNEAGSLYVDVEGREVKVVINPAAMDALEVQTLLEAHADPVAVIPSQLTPLEEFIERLDYDVLDSPKTVGVKEQLSGCLMEPPIIERVRRMRAEAGEECFIMVSLDVLRPASGLRMKLESFKLFLEQYPMSASRIKLIQYVYLNAAESAMAHRLVLEDILRLTQDIERCWAVRHKLVEIHVGSVEPADRHALFLVGDAYLNVTLRAGLCLDPYEYILVRTQHNKMAGIPGDPRCRLIISEFVGSTNTIASAVRINPWASQSIVDALDLLVFADEKLNRVMDFQLQEDLKYLQGRKAIDWASGLYAELETILEVPSGMEFSGFGHSLQLVKRGTRLPEFSSLDLVKVGHENKQLVLFCDLEGTCLPPGGDRQGTESTEVGDAPCPDPETIKGLANLNNMPKTTVVCLSGRCHKTLDRWFREYPAVSLVAEHGYWHRIDGEWTRSSLTDISTETENAAWRNMVLKIMRVSMARTPSSSIAARGSSITFNFAKSEAGWGTWQARQMVQTLGEMVWEYPVEIVQGDQAVEVRHANCNKGQSVKRFMEHFGFKISNELIIIAIGDNRSDEEMMRYLQQNWAGGGFSTTTENNIMDSTPDLFCVSVQSRPRKTLASYFMQDTEDVRLFLTKLMRMRDREGRTSVK